MEDDEQRHHVRVDLRLTRYAFDRRAGDRPSSPDVLYVGTGEARSLTGNKNWTGESAAAGTAIQYWLAARTDVSIEIADLASDEVVRTLTQSGDAGLNRIQWDLRHAPTSSGNNGFQRPGQQAHPGLYRVTMEAVGASYTALLRVLEDGWLPAPR